MTRHHRNWAIGLLTVVALVMPMVGQAETMEELKQKNKALETELAQLKAEYAKVLGLSGPAKKEILAMAGVLSAKPAMAIDFSSHSGEMCFNAGQGNMVHYAVDPAKTVEDVIYMINAKPFIDNGLQVDKLPAMPGKTGEMQPMQWYYYDGNSIEPHHGRQFNMPFLIMAIDLK